MLSQAVGHVSYSLTFVREKNILITEHAKSFDCPEPGMRIRIPVRIIQDGGK